MEPRQVEPAVPQRAEGGELALPPTPHEAHDCLHLDPATRGDAALRLKSVRGHVEGVIRMLEDPDVVITLIEELVERTSSAASASARGASVRGRSAPARGDEVQP